MRTCTKFACYLMLALVAKVYGLVQISNLQDFNFGTATLPFSTLQQTDSICLYNSANNRVWITATGTHDASGNFQLANNTSRIVYQVSVANPGANNFVQLPPGQQQNRTAQTLQATCQGLGTNRFAQLRITIPASSFNNTLTAGSYTDTLTLLLEPR